MKRTAIALTLILVVSVLTAAEMKFVREAKANPEVFAMMPHAKLQAPENTTYMVDSVPVDVTFEVSRRALYNYSYYFYDDSHPLVCINIDDKRLEIPAELQSFNETWLTYHAETILQNLKDGPHVFTCYFEATISSFYNPVADFNVEARVPTVTVLSPTNITYTNSSVPLVFTTDEQISSASYCLDSQTRVATNGNTTLTSLSDGNHILVAYATDLAGKEGNSKQFNFNVQEPPHVSFLSPRNVTLFSSNNQLTFTLSEPVSWMKYSLDGQANVTVTGNTTLPWLSSGSHSLTVYASDKAGNIGVSETIQFSIATVTWEWTAITLAPVAIIAGILLVTFRKRTINQKRQENV